MFLQQRDRMRPERNRPPRLLRLRLLSLPLEHRLADAERSDRQIEIAPPQRQQLPDPQPRRGDEADHHPIWLVDFLQELREVGAGDHSWCLSQLLRRELHPARRIDREIAVLDRRFEDARQQGP